MKSWKLLWIALMLMGCEHYSSKETGTPPDCKKFYTYIIKNAHKTYLLSLKAYDQQDTFQIVMDNYALLGLLDSTTQSHDSLRLERILRGQEAIPLSEKAMDRFKDDIVRPSGRIDTLLRYGKDSTINYFFKRISYGLAERRNVPLSYPEKNYLISKLTDWCLLPYVQDESGDLIVKELDSAAVRQ